MSEITFDNVVRAALTTKRAATDAQPNVVDPWSEAFRYVFQCHLDDEAVRWLAAKGCQGFVRTGEHCTGPLHFSASLPVCITCEAAGVVADLDAVEAKLREKWAQDEARVRYDGIMGEGTTET